MRISLTSVFLPPRVVCSLAALCALAFSGACANECRTLTDCPRGDICSRDGVCINAPPIGRDNNNVDNGFAGLRPIELDVNNGSGFDEVDIVDGGEQGAALAAAIGIPADAITFIGIANPELTAVRDNVGPHPPLAVPTLAVLSTGSAGLIAGYPLDVDFGEPGPDLTALVVELRVPEGMNSFSFFSFFLSREYPIYVGSEFNDTFVVRYERPGFDGNIVVDGDGSIVNVNNAFFDITVGEPGTDEVDQSDPDIALMQGTGFDFGGATGWLKTKAPCTPGTDIRLTFRIEDVGDGIYDSAVMLDGFQFEATPVSEATTDEEEDPIFQPVEPGDEPVVPPPLPATFSLSGLRPKQWPKRGGFLAQIDGAFLNDSTLPGADPAGATSRFFLGDVPLEVRVRDRSGAFVRVVVPALEDLRERPGFETVDFHQPLNIRAQNSAGEEDILEGVLVYIDDVPLAPPSIARVAPDRVHPNGGTRIEVFGTDLDYDVIPWFGGEAGDVVDVSPQRDRMLITSPGGLTPGFVELVLEGPGGESGSVPLAVTRDAPQDVEPGGCRQGAVEPWLLLSLSALLLRRRARRHAAALGPALAVLLVVGGASACGDDTLFGTDTPYGVSLSIRADGVGRATAAVALGEVLDLEAVANRDPDGTLYRYVVLRGPDRQGEVIAEGEGLKLTPFSTEVPGRYELSVIAQSGGDEASAPRVIVVAGDDRLVVEASWTVENFDVDLHLIDEGGTLLDTAGSDCWAFHPSPDWGEPGRDADNPILLRDEDGRGEGPFTETIVLGNADAARGYQVALHLWDEYDDTVGGAVAVELVVTRSGVEIFRGTSPTLSVDDSWTATELQGQSARRLDLFDDVAPPAVFGSAFPD